MIENPFDWSYSRSAYTGRRGCLTGDAGQVLLTQPSASWFLEPKTYHTRGTYDAILISNTKLVLAGRLQVEESKPWLPSCLLRQSRIVALGAWQQFEPDTYDTLVAKVRAR